MINKDRSAEIIINKRGELQKVLSAVENEKNFTKVDVKYCVPSINLNLTVDSKGDRVIVVNTLIQIGSRAPPSENPSGARYNKLWFYLSRRVRDRFAVCYVCSQRCTARARTSAAPPHLK